MEPQWERQSIWEGDVWAKMAGAKIISLSHDADSVTMGAEDGRAFKLDLYGDCCSQSYFTDPKQFDELLGATVLKAEERSDAAHRSTSELVAQVEKDGDVVTWHFLVFTTDKGHVTIDWHNDSNGYYDGEVILSIMRQAEAKP